MHQPNIDWISEPALIPQAIKSKTKSQYKSTNLWLWLPADLEIRLVRHPPVNHRVTSWNQKRPRKGKKKSNPDARKTQSFQKAEAFHWDYADQGSTWPGLWVVPRKETLSVIERAECSQNVPATLTGSTWRIIHRLTVWSSTSCVTPDCNLIMNGAKGQRQKKSGMTAWPGRRMW